MATKDEKSTYQAVIKLQKIMDQCTPARDADLTDDEKQYLKKLNLLTFKKMLYVFNVSEEQLDKIDTFIASLSYGFIAENNNATMEQWNNSIYLCAKLESEIVALNPQEQLEYLKQYSLTESGLTRLIKTAYQQLGLISFLTAGVKEVRAWTIRKGTLAPQAAGVIHTDFEKNFIKVEAVPYATFVDLGGWVKCREAGKVYLGGKDYEIKDGDVVDFKVGV